MIVRLPRSPGEAILPEPAAPAIPGTRGQPAAALQDVIVLPWNDADALRAAAILLSSAREAAA